MRDYDLLLIEFYISSPRRMVRFLFNINIEGQPVSTLLNNLISVALMLSQFYQT